MENGLHSIDIRVVRQLGVWGLLQVGSPLFNSVMKKLKKDGIRRSCSSSPETQPEEHKKIDGRGRKPRIRGRKSSPGAVAFRELRMAGEASAEYFS